MGMIDGDIVRAARGAAMETLGTVIGNEQMVDQGRLEQYQSLRRRQLRIAKRNWSQLSWTDRATFVARRVKR
jgi:hypothetical protein